MLDGDRLSAQSHIELEKRIRKRAHEIWLTRRSRNRHQSALDDWLQAEREILGDGLQPAQERGTTVGDAHTPRSSDTAT